MHKWIFVGRDKDKVFRFPHIQVVVWVSEATPHSSVFESERIAKIFSVFMNVARMCRDLAVRCFACMACRKLPRANVGFYGVAMSRYYDSRFLVLEVLRRLLMSSSRRSAN